MRLLPCTAPLHQEYRLPVTCNPGEPVTFDLDIRFQQVRRGFPGPPDPRFARCLFHVPQFKKDAHSASPSRARENRSGGGREEAPRENCPLPAVGSGYKSPSGPGVRAGFPVCPWSPACEARGFPGVLASRRLDVGENGRL